MLSRCRQVLRAVWSGLSPKTISTFPLSSHGRRRRDERRRCDDTQPPPLSDDELSSLVVSEPQREGWLATQSCHRPRDEALRAVIREAFITLGQEEGPYSQLDAGLADHVADYLYASLHFTFVPQLQPQRHVSVMSSKWGGLPFLFADEQWPSCEEHGCNRAPLRFFFQIRQADYPLLLQHATWVRPSSSNGSEPQDAGRLLFQFLLLPTMPRMFQQQPTW